MCRFFAAVALLLFTPAALLLLVLLDPEFRQISLCIGEPRALQDFPQRWHPVTQGGVVLHTCSAKWIFYRKAGLQSRPVDLVVAGWVFRMALFAVLFPAPAVATEAESIAAASGLCQPAVPVPAFRGSRRICFPAACGDVGCSSTVVRYVSVFGWRRIILMLLLLLLIRHQRRDDTICCTHRRGLR